MDDIRLGHRTAQTICIKFWSSVEMQIPAVATLCALMWLFTRQGAVHLPGARDQVTEGDSLNVRRYRQIAENGKCVTDMRTEIAETRLYRSIHTVRCSVEYM